MKTLLNDDDRSTVLRSSQSRQTVHAIHAEISEEYSRFQESARDLCDVALVNVNARIKIGSLLLAAKDQVGHGKFEGFMEDHCPFSIRSAQRFIKTALAADCNPITSLDGLREFNHILIEIGLKEPESHGPQQLHALATPFISIVKHLGNVRRSLGELIESRPLQAWNDDEKSQLRAELEPVARIYEELK